MVKELQCQSCGAALDVKIQRAGVIRCNYCGSNHVLEAEVRTVIADNSSRFASQLFRVIDDSFSLEELKDLVLRLNEALPAGYFLDYDDLPGGSQKAKARELVQWCRRREQLQPLVDTIVPDDVDLLGPRHVGTGWLGGRKRDRVDVRLLGPAARRRRWPISDDVEEVADPRAKRLHRRVSVAGRGGDVVECRARLLEQGAGLVPRVGHVVGQRLPVELVGVLKRGDDTRALIQHGHDPADGSAFGR